MKRLLPASQCNDLPFDKERRQPMGLLAGASHQVERLFSTVRITDRLLEGAEGPSALGIPPWRRTLGDEPARALTILSQDPVKHVDERGQSERAQDAAEWSGKLELGEQHDAPPPSPATGVLSRRTSHQHSVRLSSGTAASRCPASSSASGSSASSSRRSSAATNLAAQRQNLQPPE